MPAKARTTATNATAQAREDILNARAISALGAGVVSAMSAVGAAVIKKNKPALGKSPDWFWHMFAKCEAKAARVAEQGRARSARLRRCDLHRGLCRAIAEADDGSTREPREGAQGEVKLRSEETV